MSVSRESRESEKQWNYIWSIIPHITVCLWHPMYDQALEYIAEVKSRLTQLEEQIKKEVSNNGNK